MQIGNEYAFYNKLNEYLDLCISHAVTLEAACEAMRQAPAPPSRAQAARLLTNPLLFDADPALFYVRVPCEIQVAYAQLVHAAVEAHFPDALQLTAQAALVVMRCSVELLSQRHDGPLFRDAVRIGQACADRAAGEGTPALAAELLLQLGRVHFEPAAPDPAYEDTSVGLDMCMADRADQQTWMYDEAPASQADPLPKRAQLLDLAAGHFQNAQRLGSPELRPVAAAYLAFTRLEQAAAGPAAGRLAECASKALAAADQVPDTADPAISARLRFYALFRTGMPPAPRRVPLGPDGFYGLVTRHGLCSVAAALIIGAPQDISHQVRAPWHQDYRQLAGMEAMGERSRIKFQLRAGHCHPDDPTTCGDFAAESLTDIDAVVSRFAGDPSALRAAALHWLHHQDYVSDGTEVVRRLVVADGTPEDRYAFLTCRGAQQVNTAKSQTSEWLLAVSSLASADDLLRAGFPVWAQHSLSLAESGLERVAADGEDIAAPPAVGLLERLIESGSSADIRRKVSGIIGQVLSIAITQQDRVAQRYRGVSLSLFSAVFELAQLQKARWLTAATINGGGAEVPAGEHLLQLGARLGDDRMLDGAPDEGSDALDRGGWRLASSLTRYEARPGRTAAEILLNLRRIYGITLSRPEESGAAPAVRHRDLQAALGPQTVALNLQFCWLPGPDGAPSLSILALPVARDQAMTGATTAAVLPEELTFDALYRTTFGSDDGSLYELSPAGLYCANLFLRVQSDPLVREVSPEAAEYLAEAMGLFQGIRMVLDEADGALGTTHLAIWPTKAMYLLPYWLLPLEDGIVADRFLVTLVPTFQCLTRPQRPPAPNPVLAVGSSNGGVPHGLPAVPSLHATAMRIARAFGAEALVGRRASPAAVLSMMPHHRFVHLSAHGFQDRSAPMFHCVYLDPADDADGRLYAHKVMGLDLSAVELVTLNACEGNLLRFDEFDEISGLGAAFMRVGAAAVVGALWQIRPETGETFYAALYDHLAAGAGTLTAFRAAQQATRQRHPEYRDWGAFCFLGTGGFSEAAETGGRSTE